jgi:hypothetical protein
MAAVDQSLPLDVLPWPILRGLSAATVGRLARQISIFLVAPSMLLFVIFLCLSGIGTTFVTVSFFVSLGLFVCATFAGLLVGSVWYRAKEYFEVRHGYTSLQGGNLEVYEVVTDANLVIRRPGEPAVDTAEFDRLWKQAENKRRSKLPSFDFRRLSVPQRLLFTLALAFGLAALVYRLVA